MAFTTLMLAQLFNVFNARSDHRSAFAGLFTNRWLWGAVGLSIVLQVLVLYLPALQRAFGTVPLTGGDWLRCLAAASSVLWLREVGKVVRRRSPSFR
jgi:Ca2+-transporting ATPase